MRGFGIIALALSAALAVTGALFTGGALAQQKPALVLREGGEHPYEGMDPILAKGAPVEASIETSFAGGCATTTPIPGEITENSSVKSDSIGLVRKKQPDTEATCSGEYEGKHDTMSVVPSGQLTLSPKGTGVWGGAMKIVIETQNSFGPCGYLFGIKKVTFQPPAPGAAGKAVVSGTAKAKSGPGAKQCRVKQEAAFTFTVADDGGHPLETTLEG
jgi:hypothetical protein